MNYSCYNTWNAQNQCSLCYGMNADFTKSEGEHYHLNCLVYYSPTYPDLFKLSEHVPSEIIIPASSCFNCKSEQELSKCPQCHVEYCFSCTLKPETRVCCENFRNQFKTLTKKCIGCFYTKPNSEFCYRFKCENHDYLCLKCWSFGRTQGKCVIGCIINTNWACYANCRMCHEWRPKYLGEYRCKRNCELCDFCGYKMVVEGKKSCSICLSEINLAYY